jgi:hypothetical protein
MIVDYLLYTADYLISGNLIPALFIVKMIQWFLPVRGRLELVIELGSR